MPIAPVLTLLTVASYRCLFRQDILTSNLLHMWNIDWIQNITQTVFTTMLCFEEGLLLFTTMLHVVV